MGYQGEGQRYRAIIVFCDVLSFVLVPLTLGPLQHPILILSSCTICEASLPFICYQGGDCETGIRKDSPSHHKIQLEAHE
jgi:hypothetical protein